MTRNKLLTPATNVGERPAYRANAATNSRVVTGEHEIEKVYEPPPHPAFCDHWGRNRNDERLNAFIKSTQGSFWANSMKLTTC